MRSTLVAAMAGCRLAESASATLLDPESLGRTSDRLYASPLVLVGFQFVCNSVGNDDTVRGTEKPVLSGLGGAHALFERNARVFPAGWAAVRPLLA